MLQASPPPPGPPPPGTIEQPSSEHGGHFPPFQRETFASQFIWLAVTFIVLYVIMSRIALPRIGSIFEQRRQRIEGDYARAERLKTESEEALAAYERALAEARTRAQNLANETRAQQQAAAEARRKSLEDALNARIAEAEKTIAATRAAAMSNVQTIATEAAAAIVERLIGKTPAPDAVSNAVAQVLDHRSGG